PSLNLSHMFYADDAIFIGQWSESNIYTIVKVLDCFNRASGLRINITKSKLLGIFVEDDKVKQAAAKIGCNTLKTPFSYIGSKVGGCMSRIQSWNETIERMACRLSKWKLKTLSIRGRLTLLKSVLGSMPIYHMSLFKVPKKVLHRMESMRSYFFNGVELSSKKSFWVKWKHALAFKDKGGLGVSSLFALNRALMFKWVWRFITQGSSLWARVIKALHGYDGKIGQKVNSCYPSLWLDIIHEVEMFKSRGIDLEKVDGCILAEMMDRWFWALKGLGEFTITSVGKMIDDFMLPDVSSKTRWIKAVLIKVNVHAWKVKLDGLPTRLNISRRELDSWRWIHDDDGIFTVKRLREMIDDKILNKINVIQETKCEAQGWVQVRKQVGPWNNIMQTISELHDISMVPISVMKRKIGDGMSTLFWHDVWINDTPLAQQFPRLFLLEEFKNVVGGDRWNGSRFAWNWRRPLRGGTEDDQYHRICDIVKQVTIVQMSF
nr:RNA-directed DNA polymerase, eukaryota, reverse transcriptase zinc-binding domain protein [Tanacetum cinerariifolium]